MPPAIATSLKGSAQKASYESIGSNGAKRGVVNGSEGDDGSPKFRPMAYLTRQEFIHRVLVFTLLGAFLITIFIMAVYRFNAASASYKPSSDDLKHYLHYEKRHQKAAKFALDRFNERYEKQAKRMEAGCETTVLVFRHCEKLGKDNADTNENHHCTYMGYERAAFISTLFGNTTERWPTPAKLFALSKPPYTNYRNRETLYPLSKKIGVEVEIVDDTNVQDTIVPLFQSGELCGKTMVLVWDHEDIPDLVNALGCSTANGCPEVYPEYTFDDVWQLKYVFDPPQLYDQVPDGRKLKSQKHTGVVGWTVYATVVKQNFDPLVFSRQSGDYPENGAAKGGGWIDEL